GLEPGGHSKGCMMAEVERVLGLEEDGIDEPVVDWKRTAELRAQEIERLRQTIDALQLDRSDLKEVISLLEKEQRRAGRYLEDARDELAHGRIQSAENRIIDALVSLSSKERRTDTRLKTAGAE